MSYLTPDGRARGAAVRLRRRPGWRCWRRWFAASRAAAAEELGNFWRDLYRSIVYILLPLSIVLAVILISQGVPQTFHGHVTATTLQGAAQTIARGPVASMIAIKQLGHERRRLLQLELGRPVREPDAVSNFLEMLAILLIPFAQVVMFGRMVFARRHAWVLVRGRCFAMFAIGVAVALPVGAARLGGAARSPA